jgi:hypothetical protein
MKQEPAWIELMLQFGHLTKSTTLFNSRATAIHAKV